MDDVPLHETRGDYALTTDRAAADVDRALALLQTTDWASTMTREQLLRAIDNSIIFSVTRHSTLVAVARVVTDLSTYAYLTDVVVAESARGAGIGKWLVETILAHPQLQGVRRFALLTSDAQELYRKYGFSEELGKLTYMERKP